MLLAREALLKLVLLDLDLNQDVLQLILVFFAERLFRRFGLDQLVLEAVLLTLRFGRFSSCLVDAFLPF